MLKDLVNIDKRFESSVNLYLDIDNTNKINNYVYTRSSQNIMDFYLENIEKDRNHATMLVGPYGKGKSHMLLVLLDRVRHMARPYLPVIISGTNEDLNQAFLFGITDALRRAQLEDIIPASYYSEAEKKILQWRESFPDAYRSFVCELQKNGIPDADTFVRRLRRNDGAALELFRSIYPVITSGSEFNPIILLETVRIYEEIKEALSRDYGYSGIYIIFDEFSKYIEGHEKETFSRDMKVLQDMCELAAKKSEGRMFLTFVAHKSIREYGARLPFEVKNAFRGVEGRLKEVLFVVSSQNNYELIGNVIRKDEKALERIRGIRKYYDNAMRSYRIPCFSALFDEEDYKKYVVEGCFPLMPLTAYMLLLISEKSAQNERSIFTYLSHDEKGSLCRMVDECRLDEADLGITADTIYDYFKSLFRGEDADSLVHNEWLKAEYALSRTDDAQEKKVIKVIALIGMIARPDEVLSDIPQISGALNISEQECRVLVDRLLEKRIIIYRPRRHEYCFYNNVGVDIQAEIADRAAKLSANTDILGVLRKISELDYVLPKKYNQDFSMTRYFEYVFMSPEQIERLPSPELLFEEHFSDGKIVAVVSESSHTEHENCPERLRDDRIVVLLSHSEFNQTDNIRRYIVAQELMRDKSFIDENAVLEQELVNFCDDIVYEVNRYLETAYDAESGACTVYHSGERYAAGFRQGMSFNMFLSSIMSDYYSNAPIVNNELINRQSISAQNKKARNRIIEMILAHEDFAPLEKGTSPEATIYRAVLINTGVMGGGNMDAGCERVLTEIERFIARCDSNKTSFGQLYDRIMGIGYGVRKGIIPIYIALCLSRLQDKPIITLKDREVALDARIMGNINDEPESYYLYVEHESVEKKKYLLGIKELFGENDKKLNTADDRAVLELILRWYRALPQATLRAGHDVADEETALRIKELGNMLKAQEYNPHEFLFTELPKRLGLPEGDYEAALAGLTAVKKYMDGYLLLLSDKAAQIIIKRCGGDEGDSLRSVLSEYCSLHAGKQKGMVLKSRTSAILSYLSGIQTYDDFQIISRLSKLVTDIYIDDWRDGMIEGFKKGWDDFCTELEKQGRNETGQNSIILKGAGKSLLERSYEDIEDDSTCYFLKNAIKEAIEEFGDSLETNEKVAVLARVLAELVAGEE